MNSQVLDFVKNLKAGEHVIFFYTSLKEKREVLFTFLEGGFERGEGAVYIAGQETPKQIREGVKAFGINVKELEKDGVLKIINYDQWYVIEGKVNISNILASWQKAYADALERGLHGLRVCGETTCFFENGKEEELVAYEKAYHRKTKNPITALCAYNINDIRSLNSNLLLDLIKAHEAAVTQSFAHTVNFESLYAEVTERQLEATFGRAAAQTIFKELKRVYSLSKDEIGEEPEVFIKALNDLLGYGSKVIEREISRALCSRIGLQL